MPAQSQNQARFLNWKFGHDWVKQHHFDNPWGKLPEYARKRMWLGGAIGMQKLRGGAPRSILPRRRPGFNSAFMPRGPLSVGRRLPMAGGGKVAGTPSESALMRQLLDKYLGTPTDVLEPDFIRRKVRERPRIMAAKGYADFNPDNYTFFAPGTRDDPNRLGFYTNRPNNVFTGEPGTRDNPISLARPPGSSHQPGDIVFIGGPFGWGRYDDRGGAGEGDIAVGGQYTPMVRKGFMPRLFQSGRNLVTGNLGKTPRDAAGFRFDNSGPGYAPVMDPSGNQYFGRDPGNTQGGRTMDPTNWVYVPGVGNVPRAILNNEQASNNPLDYFPRDKSMSPRDQYGPGSGAPTRKIVGGILGTLSNFLFPGLGFVVTPLVKTIIAAVQKNGLPVNNQTVQAQAKQMGVAPAALKPVPTDTGDFGRPSPGDFGNNASTWGSNTTSFIGGGGNPNLPTGGSYFTGRGNLTSPGGAGVNFMGDPTVRVPGMDAIAMRAFRQGNPSMGFGPGSAVYDYAANYAGTPQGRINSRNVGMPVVNPAFLGPGGTDWRSNPEVGWGGAPFTPALQPIPGRSDLPRGGPNRRAMAREAGGGVIRQGKRKLKGYGRDTVPAALTPGEVVLNADQQRAVMPIPGLEHRLLPEQLRALAMMRSGRS